MNSWEYYPKEFSSYEEYVKYLKEKGLALEALGGMYNKIMDYEKKYKNALERAKEKMDEYKRLDGEESFVPSDIEYIFPELKENEDERVRKEIIKLVNFFYGSSLALKQTVSKDEMVAWLEKQGAQKPKHFELKAGHWYICYRAYCCRADNLTVKEGERFMCEEDGVVKGFVIKEPEKYFKEVCAAPIEIEQKPAWSEEDKDALDIAIRIIQNGGDDCSGILDSNKALNWLKSLKPQSNLYDKGYNDGYSAAKYNHWKPSDEQMKALKFTVNDYCMGKLKNNLESLYNDIKNL